MCAQLGPMAELSWRGWIGGRGRVRVRGGGAGVWLGQVEARGEGQLVDATS